MNQDREEIVIQRKDSTGAVVLTVGVFAVAAVALWWWLSRQQAPPPPPAGPKVINTVPANGATGVALNQHVTVFFDSPMKSSATSIAINPDPGIWATVWDVYGLSVSFYCNQFALNTLYTCAVTGKDQNGNPLQAGPVANPWSFTTGAGPPATGVLEVKVFDASIESNLPVYWLAGASVTLSGAGSGSGLTDANGKVVFTGIVSGQYLVTATVSGYNSRQYIVQGVNGQTVSYTASITPMTFTRSFPSGNVALYIPRGDVLVKDMLMNIIWSPDPGESGVLTLQLTVIQGTQHVVVTRQFTIDYANQSVWFHASDVGVPYVDMVQYKVLFVSLNAKPWGTLKTVIGSY